jgi:hypothetical protein
LAGISGKRQKGDSMNGIVRVFLKNEYGVVAIPGSYLVSELILEQVDILRSVNAMPVAVF